tara:strand:- start:167 stop:826 length:660 start_codon:yes stop_codon:yes gene_type:complete
MVKHKEQYDDDIDLLELFLAFWKYKITIALLMVIGLILGLAFTYQQEPLYKTQFSVILGHPAYSPSLLLSSSSIENFLSEAELNPDKMPRFGVQINKKTGLATFEVQSLSPDVHEEIGVRFKEIIAIELEQQKRLALIEKGKKRGYIIVNQVASILPYIAITESSVEDILKEFQITFGPTKTVQPNPRKYGILGMFAGLLLAGCWMVLSYFYRAIQNFK